MVVSRLRLNLVLVLAYVTLSFAQYYPQQQYYWPQQQQQQFYYPQQQQQVYYPQQQQPQQTIIYQQQQPLQPQQPQQQQQQPRFVQPQPQPQLQQPQFAQQSQQALPQVTIYREQPKIAKPVEEFDIPPPPSQFLPDGAKVIQHPVRQNSFRRGGQINNGQRRPLTSRQQQHIATPQQPQRRVDVAHTRAPPTRPVVTTPRPVATRRPPPPPPATIATTAPRRPSPPNTSHLSSMKNPNSYFLDCCKNKKVAKSCESRCNFDVLSKKVLTGMFLGSDVCPQKHGLDLFSCAAQDSNHIECCKTKNVQRTGAGEKCLNFCNMSPGSNFQADASYLPCWAVLNDIKSCFKEAIINGHTL